MKIIISLATIPARIEFIEPVLISLIRQSHPPDEIHLQIPEFNVRDHSRYTIPGFIHNYPKVYIKRPPRDFGAANKWLHPLKYLPNDNQMILIIVDDDCSFASNTVEVLLNRMLAKPNICFCFTGGTLPTGKVINSFVVAKQPQKNALTIREKNEEDLRVDTVQGFSAFGLKPSWFRKFDFSVIESEEKIHEMNDDIIISGILEYLDIGRIQIGPYQIPEILPQASINPIHGDGRLTGLTLNSISYLQHKLNIWQRLLVKPHKKPSLFGRAIKKMVRILMKNQK